MDNPTPGAAVIQPTDAEAQAAQAAADKAAAEAKAKETAGAAAPAKDTPKPTAPGQEAAPSSLMDDATAEEKAAQEAENKRLLEAKDEDLNDEEKAQKAELLKAKTDADKAAGVPEKYEFKAPEGMTLDQTLVDKVVPIFKELKLSQAQADKLVDFYGEQVKAIETAQKDNFTKFIEGLKAETIKTLGADYKKELSFAAKSRDRFASKELVEKLNQSGLANDVDMIRLFINIGKKISEDKVITGQGSATSEGPNALDILYDKTPKTKT